MLRVFPSLVIADLLVLLGAGVLGLMVDGRHLFPQHFILAMFAIVLTVFTHVVAFTYFAASSRMMSQAVLIGRLDASSLKQTRAFQARAGRMVALGMLAIVAVVCYAGLIESDAGWHLWHGAAAAVAVAVNAYCFYVDIDLIHRNAALMRGVFDDYNDSRKSTSDERSVSSRFE